MSTARWVEHLANLRKPWVLSPEMNILGMEAHAHYLHTQEVAAEESTG